MKTIYFKEKITRVLQLWQKYNILDTELIDKLNRISTMATIDCAINNTQQETPTKTDNTERLKRLNYLQHKLTKLQEQQKNSNKVTLYAYIIRANFRNLCLKEKVQKKTFL